MSTQIEWAANPDGTPGETWNPTAGCQRCSPGCLNCYAERDTARLAQSPNPKVSAKYKGLTVIRNGRPTFNGTARPWPEHLHKPLGWRKSRTVFVNSMSDLWHKDIPFGYIAQVFAVMAAMKRHRFIILTKRPESALEWFRWVDQQVAESGASGAQIVRHHWRASMQGLEWAKVCTKAPCPDDAWPLPNVAIGVSVCDQDSTDELVPQLLRIPAERRLLSVEPMIGPVDLHEWLAWQCFRCAGTGDFSPLQDVPECPVCHGSGLNPPLAQVIIGAESGPRARSCQIEWARDLAKQVLDAQEWARMPQYDRVEGWQHDGPRYRVSGPSLFVKQWPLCGACDGRGIWTADAVCVRCGGSWSPEGRRIPGDGQSRDAMTRKRDTDKTPKLYVPGHGVGPWTQGIRWPT